MIDVTLKLTPEERATIKRASYRLGKYDWHHDGDGEIYEYSAENAGPVGTLMDDYDAELAAAMYNAFARTFGEYPGDVRIAAQREGRDA